MKEDSTNLVIRVLDSSFGISKHIESSIFERSFNAKEKSKRTGLGLSYVKKVMEAHHGSISIDHSYKNTCFVIKLPYKNSIVTEQKVAT